MTVWWVSHISILTATLTCNNIRDWKESSSTMAHTIYQHHHINWEGMLEALKFSCFNIIIIVIIALQCPALYCKCIHVLRLFMVITVSTMLVALCLHFGLRLYHCSCIKNSSTIEINNPQYKYAREACLQFLTLVGWVTQAECIMGTCTLCDIHAQAWGWQARVQVCIYHIKY